MMNKEAMKKMVKNFGVAEVIEFAKQVNEEIRKEEAKYTTMISMYDYSSAGRNKNRTKSIVFPDWVTKTLDNIIKETGIKIYKKGSGDKRSMAITNEDFAKYVIYTCDDGGKTLRNIIEILMSAPAWCKGMGLTRSRMELVFHVLVLHREHTEDVARILRKLLKKYDPASLKVTANASKKFRYVLNHEIQMIGFAERYVCKRIADKRKFKIAA